VLREQTDALNRPFFKAIASGLPWVTLKAGITLDGKLATRTGRSKWITGERAREAAHHLRDRADAIVVGVGTVLADDPRLTTRLPNGRTAVRVVLDSHLRAPARAAIFDVTPGRTILATLEPATAPRAKALTRRGVEVWTLPAKRGQVSLPALLKRLAGEGLLHVLVEGGAAVHGAFLTARLVDEVALFVAPTLFGHAGLTWTGGLDVSSPARALRLGPMTVEQVGRDLLVRATTLPVR
jgi:diaminohydroxyphosphoribosylaminopyrimidine deaminase/5-amino-6-(5-phosphoribosylamino)uracil reductase